MSKGFIRSHCTILRQLNKHDIPLLLEWISDPEIRRYVLNAFPFMVQAEEKWLEDLSRQQVEGKNMAFMIETLDGRPIGTMGLHQINLVHRYATTGALLGDKAYWGKGYGVASKMYLLKYAFEELGLNRVNSTVIEYNERSIRYSQRCGYVIEGCKRKSVYKDGRYWDEIILGVLREEWEKAFEEYLGKLSS